VLSVIHAESHKKVLYARCHIIEGRYAECHYAECHYADMRGVTEMYSQNWTNWAEILNFRELVGNLKTKGIG